MYLYIFENGDVAKAGSKPTKEDLKAVADGVLQIFKYELGNFHSIGSDGEFFHVPFTCVRGTKGLEYHAFPEG